MHRWRGTRETRGQNVIEKSLHITVRGLAVLSESGTEIERLDIETEGEKCPDDSKERIKRERSYPGHHNRLSAAEVSKSTQLGER